MGNYLSKLQHYAAKLGINLDEMDEDETENDSQNAGVPRAHLDELQQWCKNFDRRNPPDVNTVRYDWTGHFDDGAEAIYIAGNMQRIREALYEQRYPQLKAERLIPHDTSTGMGIEREVIRTLDAAGDPVVTRDQPDDVPNVELTTGQADVKFFEMSLGYSYSDTDVEKAMRNGMPLPYEKAKWTRDIMARKKDTIAFIGAKEIGTTGLLNATGTTVYATPATGAGGSKKFKDKSSDAVILDLNAPADKVNEDTNELEECDTWLLPSDAYNHIQGRRIGDGTSETILSYFKRTRQESSDFPIHVEKTMKSKAGKIPGVAVSRMLVYRNDSSKLQFKVPLPFLQKQPQVVGFKTTTLCRMRLGELALYVPASMCQADDVS